MVAGTGSVRIILLELDPAGGVGRARNAGLERARGDPIIFLDDDCLAERDLVRQAVEVHARHPEALLINGNSKPFRRDIYSDFWFHYYAAAFNTGDGDFYPINRVSSGNFSIKRELLARVSPLFDESLTSREDFDLYLRLKEQGIPAYKSDHVVAYNVCRDTLRGFLRQRLWYVDGEEQLRAKHDPRLVIEEERRGMPPHQRRFFWLYLAIRASSRWRGLRKRACRLVGVDRLRAPSPAGARGGRSP